MHYLLLVVHERGDKPEEWISDMMEPFRWSEHDLHPDFYWDNWVIGGRWDGGIPGNTCPIEEWPDHFMPSRLLAGGLPISLYGDWEDHAPPTAEQLKMASLRREKIIDRYPGHMISVVDYHN